MRDITKSDIKGFSGQVMELVTGEKTSFGFVGFPDPIRFYPG